MPNDAFTQQALASDKRFILRVQNALCTVAWTVLNEASSVTGHAQRATYARQVLGAPATYAAQLALSLVTQQGVMNFTTSYDFVQGAVVSACGDPDLVNLLTTDWNGLAGA